MFCWEAGVHCVHVRFDLHRSQVTGQFLCTLRYPYLQSINKENKVRVLKFYYSIDSLASDINLQAYPNHRITGGYPSHWVLLKAGVLQKSIFPRNL